MTTQPEARQTPLPDLLDQVPEDIVLGIPGDEPVFQSYTNIPIGKLAHQAAAELRRLHEENERLKTVPMKYRRMEFNAQLQEENKRLHEVNQELLGTLQTILNISLMDKGHWAKTIEQEAHTAIAKATGEQA